ncbi:ATP-dependent DNA helicase RecG [candidate division KSB1 bacterium]|nr:ATP-dependent DNA helicase RecG [candidate division KSB1 bacterium]
MDDKQQHILDSSPQYLKGIGEKRANALRGIGVHTVRDLLYYFPRRYLDRSNITPMQHIRRDQTITAVGKVISANIVKGRKTRYVLLLSDNTGFLMCVWFNRVQYWEKLFKTGETLAVSGKVTYFNGNQLIHPEFDRLTDEDGESNDEKFLHTGAIIPLYASTEALTKIGLDSRGFRRIIKNLLRTHSDSIPEILSDTLVQENHLISLQNALNNIHFPHNFSKLEAARRRLKFDELFYLQLMLAYRKRSIKALQKGIEFKVVGERTRQLVERLPFKFTDAQRKVLGEIRIDMKNPHPMYRLIQGDVGSGKTIVALVSMLMAIENGFQTALMAPTEILAEQHYLTTHHLLEDLGVNTKLLIGAQRKTAHNEILNSIQDGSCDIVIGTHALIQENVVFKNLGLIVIDEQHRFGVMQRMNLMSKGHYPDILVMTATPIPRTLSLTTYGDLDISVIDQMPAGRRPVKTHLRTADKRDKIYEYVKTQVGTGNQAYIVFPLIEESEKMDLQAATEAYERMSQTIFSQLKLALLHGRMKSEEKDDIMSRFKSRDIEILVSTTVIEVGVDIPNANLIVIENAERFGLSQLHQLRGRVGRGSEQAHCILIAKPPLTHEARSRLNALVDTNDGFKIAEYDLQLRGPGEFFGTKQHGMPELRIADPLVDKDLLLLTREKAFELVDRDPQLLDKDNKPIHDNFSKFHSDKFKLLRSG